MIYDGALAADGVLHTGIWIWAIIIGVLIIVWILIGITNLGKLNTVAMTALFYLIVGTFKVIFFGNGSMPAICSNDGSLDIWSRSRACGSNAAFLAATDQ